MLKFKRLSTLVIPRIYENTTWFWQITEALIRISRQYRSKESTQTVFYYMSDKNLYIPRFFPINDYVQCEIEDQSLGGETIDIETNIKPRDEVQIRAIQHMLKNPNATMQLEPGVGKTVISIYVVGELKKKTLVLVHRDSLVEQWRDRFEQFTNISKDNISTLSSKTFEKDLKKPIIISTVQTFLSILKNSRNEFLQEIYKANIGIFIADEVHTTVGAKTFSECSAQMPAKYVYGLSATPYRLDGNGDIILYHLGPIYTDENSGSTVPAKVTVILFNSGLKKQKTNAYINFGGIFRKERYLNKLCSSKSFEFVCKFILDRMVKQNKNIVFVGERIDKMLSNIYEWTTFQDKAMFIAGIKNEVLTKQLIFTTPNKMRDGVDAPWKDCLIMTSPIGNISQMCGRVTRAYKNKDYTTIIDMCDLDYYDISKTLRARLTYYENKNWETQFILINSDGNKFVKITKETALQLTTRS